MIQKVGKRYIVWFSNTIKGCEDFYDTTKKETRILNLIYET